MRYIVDYIDSCDMKHKAIFDNRYDAKMFGRALIEDCGKDGVKITYK